MRKGIMICAILGMALASALQHNTASAQEKITLGHLNSFSGGTSLYGEDSRRGISLAIDEINAKGGFTVGGKKYTFDIVHLDTKYQVAPAVSAYQKLIDRYNVKFIHNMGTVTGRAIMQYNEKDGVLLDIISPSESLNKLGNKLVLNQVPRPSGYDPPVVTEAVKRGGKTMCIIAEESDFGREHAEVIKGTLESLGGKVLSLEFVQANISVDFMAVLTKVKGLKPDMLHIVAVEEPGIRIAKQAMELGIKARFLFTEHFKMKSIDMLGIKNLEGALFTGSLSTLCSVPIKGTSKEIVAYRNAYLKKYPGTYLSATGNYGYNWIHYLAGAMEMAGTVSDVHKIRAACNESIKHLSMVKYGGFTKGGRAYGAPIFVLCIENGEVKVMSSVPYPESQAARGEPK